ncbi:branched-chain amino acid transport system substrate-binding protein [Neorhizobium galegae]|uniref:ABC transporter substrate-binding protein n=1 Tax=Neorhizobium galegae TaxID=399 RepID=UPI001AEAD85A|nr:ABC transporter substrate-binding protein [Neorhizobium galegae]MBP2563438.1 branched-chain amino acid transport system substrate-binding protein [Neorhizobium galegae]MDQ0138233.1 branched-chain amino acid transport system substrate-binding protein [Neorhizobium galegae]
MSSFTINRRVFMGGVAGLAATGLLPHSVMAQGGPIRLGALTPLTGSGGPYGPVMVKAIQAVAGEVNKAGGVLGRQIEIISEDDQTNPEAGVRAARKLVDVDKVSAILGTWASSVTTAVAPICWESGTLLATVSGADAITALPHQGYIIRTQPTTILQGRKFGEFAVEQGVKKLFFFSPQTPFAESQFNNITAAVKAAGGETKSLIYDDKKPSYRSEVDEMLAYEPDVIVLGGYAADTTVLLKDIFRSGYEGKKIAFAYSVNQKLIDSVPAEIVEGIYTIAPSPAQSSSAYKRLVSLIGVENPDPYTTQVYDQANLIIMAIAKAGAADGKSIRDAIRSVSQAQGGDVVDNAVDGLKLIAAGKPINYQGASGPCDFTATGDISDSQFRYEQVEGGKLKLLKIA